MELRHLKYFLAVAEELHFARAAEKLHIEQSPLSRAIKELEEELGVVLFARTTRSTRLTRAGKLFLEHARRVFAVLQQARDSVKAAANGFHGQLRVALSDGITPSRLPAVLALCRQEEPEVEIRFSEVPLSQQIKGLHDDLYDVGFAQSDEVGDGIVAIPVWSDALMVAVPARHPLLAHKRIPLEELLRYPLVLCDPQVCESHAKHVDRILRRADMEPFDRGARGLLRFDDGACIGRLRAWAYGCSTYYSQQRAGGGGSSPGITCPTPDNLSAAPYRRTIGGSGPIH